MIITYDNEGRITGVHTHSPVGMEEDLTAQGVKFFYLEELEGAHLLFEDYVEEIPEGVLLHKRQPSPATCDTPSQVFLGESVRLRGLDSDARVQAFRETVAERDGTRYRVKESLTPEHPGEFDYQIIQPGVYHITVDHPQHRLAYFQIKVIAPPPINPEVFNVVDV